MSMGNPNYLSANSFVLVRCYMCIKGLEGGKSTFNLILQEVSHLFRR